jgi:hypothetical protein
MTWEENHITDEDTKVAQLEITFNDRTLDEYMGLATNNPARVPTTIKEVKRQLINNFKNQAQKTCL